MSIQERIADIENKFNQLKELHKERQEIISKAQQDIVEIEKELILLKGKHEAYIEMLEETQEASQAE